MSVFRGSIAEYPGVVVDNFTNCERGRAFFLSHCHKDHMTGLSSPAIFNTLQRRKASLYCSEVTQSLLLKDPTFTQLAPFLKGLPMEQPVSMTLDPSADAPPLNFTVTLLPAGHCPGSAMFFFQGEKGNVLYTGDFRLTLDETKRLGPLHCDKRLLDITSVYLDTTFCHPIATKIPSRDVSRDLVVNQIDSWLKQDPTNVVHLQCGMFGYEHIFMALARKFNTKIHIAAWKINAYSDLPSVVECLTTEGNTTRIHCCNFRRGVKSRVGLPCGSFNRYGRPPTVLSIRPSTMWFVSSTKGLKDPFVFIPECNFFRVLHSMHASYSELCDFVSYLKPKRIVPCVVPVGDSSITEVNARLKMLLAQSKVQDPKQLPEPKLTTRNSSQRRKRSRDNSNLETEQEHCNVERFDTDGCNSSDDTIDEFISSEDISQANRMTFSRSTDNGKSLLNDQKLLGLPSMLSTNYTSAIGHPSALWAAKNGSDGLTSVRSSGSVTVGSLEQTSLELSEDSTPEESVAVTNCKMSDSSVGSKEQSQTGRGKDAKEREISSKIKDDGNEKGLLLLQPSLDLSLGECSPVKHEPKLRENATKKEKVVESGTHKLYVEEDEWHLTLECSSEEEKKSFVIDTSGNGISKSTSAQNNSIAVGKQLNVNHEELTPKVADSTVPPPAKRHKRSSERKRRSRHGREQTDLSTPVEGDMAAMATPRKLFHKSNSKKSDSPKKQKKRHRKMKSKRDKEETKEIEIIDLTQDDDDDDVGGCHIQKHVVTGNTKTNNVMGGVHKRKPPSFVGPHPENHDHHSSIRTCNKKNELDSEVDCDITFCEDLEGPEATSDTLGSPFYLPPTPGREDVTSILERKSIAFSD